MSVKSKIKKALFGIMEEGEVEAGYIGKGYHYNGATESNGWHFKPFQGQTWTLGDNEDEAMETIEQTREYQESVAEQYRRSGW